jgi:RimJ/RimL family protein N-acetyltransferase
MSIVEPKEIIAMVKKENTASRGLMESCGFREAAYGDNVQIDENGEMRDSFETVEYVIPIFNN